MSLNRIINLHVFDPNKLRFETEAQVKDFYAAVGRIALWGIPGFGEANDGSFTQTINMSIDPVLEIMGCYYAAIKYNTDEGYDEHRKFYAIDNALEPFKSQHPFVLAAIPHDDGYSFHS